MRIHVYNVLVIQMLYLTLTVCWYDRWSCSLVDFFSELQPKAQGYILNSLYQHLENLFVLNQNRIKARIFNLN